MVPGFKELTLEGKVRPHNNQNMPGGREWEARSGFQENKSFWSLTTENAERYVLLVKQTVMS